MDNLLQELISDLQILIRQPSISATKQGLEECAILLFNMMKNAGIQTELLYLDNQVKKESGTDYKPSTPPPPPLVFGSLKSKSNPNAKTILFYNHYDVQPVDPLEKWDDDPFSGKIIENTIFGRGSSDDKGEFITRLKAVEFFLKSTGDVPCNIKFLLEGEEEIGSPNLGKYLAKYKDRLKSDIVIWESGYIDKNKNAIISLGQKGILNVEIVVQGPKRDVHSSLAVAIENPAWTLIHILSSISDKQNNILIKDWYNESKPLSLEESNLIEKEPFFENDFKNEYGIPRFKNNKTGDEIKKDLVVESTCNISGLSSGYTNNGIKTILPSNATVKIDFRLNPFMDPINQYNKLVKHIRDRGYSEEEVKIIYLSGEPAHRTNLNNKYLKLIIQAASEIFNGVILNISSAGTGPMYTFKKYLNVDSVCIGSTIMPNKMHSPNEFTNIDLLKLATNCFIQIINKISQI